MTESKIRVLVAEDELIIAEDIRSTLEENGYSVISVVDNGKDVIRICGDQEPDLILMDIMLKGKISGIEAAEIINKTKTIPIIYLSALRDDETFLNAHATKPFAYLVKPFRRADLLKKVAKAFKTAG